MPLSVGGCTIATASAKSSFRTDVAIRIALLFETSFIKPNNFSTLCPVFAEINNIGAYDKYASLLYTSFV